ncbi:DNA-binding GntR family transcriptional regulator [Cytobacillus oceanisediminis]|uniref:DNA-binding GntR family transcriptional regulator n=1 Tax=Cytobacillus oceanisediminis TaxID=665099 RepID=A0A2V3A6B4_9BACI|nr:GntR family transcriptional regulator [Cytobacillus oceanisediminis]PWW31420.1 DNA-binding GntR family transcriptional regulator [Cytobacillus oceanisediminis]
MSNLNMNPVKSKTTKEIVYDEIKNAIFNGSIKGDEVITETILAQSLNTSRTPVREAVGDLLKDGLLVSVPRKGLKVREITPSEKDQIIFLRISIETEGLKRIIPVIKPSHIQYLNDLIEMQKEAMEKNDRIEFIELDQKFHRKILFFAEQHLLGDILLNLYNLTRLIGHQALAKKGRMEEVIVEHSQIVEALQLMDELQATKLMEQHLLQTKESIEIVEGN